LRRPLGPANLEKQYVFTLFALFWEEGGKGGHAKQAKPLDTYNRHLQ